MWTNEKFSSKLAQSYTFYGQIENNKFSFCIIDEGSNELIHLQEIPGKNLLQDADSLSKVLRSNEQLQLDFAHIRISILETRSTLLPQGDETLARDIANFELGQLNQSELLLHTDISKSPVKLIAVIEEPIKNLIDQFFNNVSIHALGSSFLDETGILAKFQKQSQMFWHISKGISLSALYQNGNLLWFNRFELTNTEDLLYYTLNVLEQKSIKAEDIQLNIAGQIQSISLNQELISSYLHSVHILSEIHNLNTGLVADQAISRNFCLINQFLCE